MAKYVIMKATLRSSLILLCGVLEGCASSTARTERVDQLTPDNYRQVIEITKRDKEFVSATYIGPQSACFPPIQNPICAPLVRGEPIYRANGKVNVEEFSIKASMATVFRDEQTKELMYLVASDLAVQRGFTHLTVLEEARVSGCTSYDSISTHGTLTGDTYRGSTTVRNNPICRGIFTIDVLLFSDNSTFAEGVFYWNKFGSPQMAPTLLPEQRLYFGTSYGLDSRYYSDINKDGVFTSTPYEAWKVRYDASGLSEALREKYGVASAAPLAYADEHEVRASRPISPIDANRKVE
jgi:hypothetical protein